MKKILYKLIDNRKITLFFVFIIIAAGVLGYMGSPKQESPDFSIPYAMITTVFPGASQNDVDTYVTVPIVKRIKEIEGFKTSSSYSSNSLSLVILELDFNSDIDKSFSELKESMRALQSSLPKECSEINVNTDITDTAGVIISLSSDELSNKDISYYAKQTGEALLKIEGMAKYEITGSLDTVIKINVSKDAMKMTGLTLAEISDLIKGGNLDIPIGKIKYENENIVVNYNGFYENIDDVGNLVVGYSAQLQKLVRLKDIAEIAEETAVSNTYYRHNGRDSVIISGYFDEGINIVPLEKEIADKLSEIEKDFPADLDTSLIISQPAEVKDSLIQFSNNLIFAILLVILVILIGMGLRNAMVVSVSLPLSVLMSFGAMYLLGIKVHQVSIAALIVCLGMLVDNSIVVSDSIQGYIDEGIKKRKACMLGVKDVAGPVFTSTITTIAAFIPFLLLNSIAGDFIKSLPQIVAISLAASYLTAMLIIPVLGFILFKKKKDSTKRKRGQIFKRVLKGGLKHKWIVIGLVIIIIGGSVFIAMDLDMVFFPASSKNIVYVDVRNNNSDNLQETNEIIKKIENIVKNEEEVTEYISAYGGGLPRFNQIMFVYTKTPDIGQLMMRVDLEDSEYNTNEDFKLHLQEVLDQAELNAKITVKELMYAFPMDEDLKIRITGDNLETLKNSEEEVYKLLKNKVGLVNVSKGNTNYINEYNLDIQAEKAAEFGLLVPAVQNELSIAILGRESAVVRSLNQETPIIVTGEKGDRNSLEGIPIRTASGEYIDSKTITELSQVKILSTIPRYNGEYAMTLTADYDLSLDKADILQGVKSDIESLGLEKITVFYEGEDELIKENFGQVGVLGIVALIAVFIILMLQFKSFSMPLLIFITIPLSAVGSVLGLYITGQALSFTALLGVVSLLGIVVNNAIILIDFIKKRKQKGLKLTWHA